MRIMSKFRDYYDTALAFGFDEKVLYLRKELDAQRLDAKKWPGLFQAMKEMPRTDDLCIPYLILFCGQVYPAWHIYQVEYQDDQTGSYKKAAGRTGYSIEEWMRLLTQDHLWSISSWRVRSRGREKYLEEVIEKPDKKRNRSVLYQMHPSRIFPFGLEGGALWREKHKQALTDIDAFHIAHNAPIAILEDKSCRGVCLTVNPQLKEYNFARVFDPCTAFQEIHMYLSGGPLAKQTDPIPEVTDEVMRDAKGFDNRSFKTDSPGKKERRRARRAKRK